jgi:hypothetical protein
MFFKQSAKKPRMLAVCVLSILITDTMILDRIFDADPLLYQPLCKSDWESDFNISAPSLRRTLCYFNKFQTVKIPKNQDQTIIIFNGLVSSLLLKLKYDIEELHF